MPGGISERATVVLEYSRPARPHPGVDHVVIPRHDTGEREKERERCAARRRLRRWTPLFLRNSEILHVRKVFSAIDWERAMLTSSLRCGSSGVWVDCGCIGGGRGKGGSS
jgi:hypothetical protein